MRTLSSTERARESRSMAFTEGVPLVVFPRRGQLPGTNGGASARACAMRYLPRLGCIVFRGFGIHRPADFQRFAQAFAGHGDRAEHAAFAPLHRGALLVHAPEAEQLRDSTRVACRRELARSVPVSVRTRLLERGLCYERNFGEPGLPSWRSVFASETRSTVEAWCRANDVHWQWSGPDALRLLRHGPVLQRHAASQDLLWSNDLLSFYRREHRLHDARQRPAHDVYHADGGPIEAALISEIAQSFEDTAMLVPWERGDVMMLDGATMSASGLMSCDPSGLWLAPSLGVAPT